MAEFTPAEAGKLDWRIVDDGVMGGLPLSPMCNTYGIVPKRGAKGLAQQVNEAAAKLVSDLVRKSDPGVVVRADGRVEIMRWVFHSEPYAFEGEWVRRRA